MRTAIASSYAEEKTSLRALAKRFGTSLATVLRCIGSYHQPASEGVPSALFWDFSFPQRSILVGDQWAVSMGLPNTKLKV